MLNENQIQIQIQFKFKNILFGINTKAHTLTNGESETQQGFIWLYAHNYIVRYNDLTSFAQGT